MFIFLPTRINYTLIDVKSTKFKINFYYSINPQNDQRSKVVAWQRPTLAERQSDYHRR